MYVRICPMMCCCLLVLDSVTSPPQCICQPKPHSFVKTPNSKRRCPCCTNTMLPAEHLKDGGLLSSFQPQVKKTIHVISIYLSLSISIHVSVQATSFLTESGALHPQRQLFLSLPLPLSLSFSLSRSRARARSLSLGKRSRRVS